MELLQTPLEANNNIKAKKLKSRIARCSKVVETQDQDPCMQPSENQKPKKKRINAWWLLISDKQEVGCFWRNAAFNPYPYSENDILHADQKWQKTISEKKNLNSHNSAF